MHSSAASNFVLAGYSEQSGRIFAWDASTTAPGLARGRYTDVDEGDESFVPMEIWNRLAHDGATPLRRPVFASPCRTLRCASAAEYPREQSTVVKGATWRMQNRKQAVSHALCTRARSPFRHGRPSHTAS